MGRITIDTGFDLSGLRNGFGKAINMSKSFVNSVTKNISGIGKSFESTTAAIMKQQNVVDRLKSKYDALATGEVAPRGLASLEAQLLRAQDQTSKLAAEFEKLAQAKEAIEAKTIIAEGKPFLSEADTAKIAEINTKMDEVAPKWEKAEASAAQYQARIEQIRATPLDTDEGKRLAGDLSVANQKLSEMQTKASQVGKTGPAAMRDTGRAAQTASKQTKGFGNAISGFAKRIKSLFAAVLVFQVIRTALRGLRDYLETALKANKDFVNSFGQVKANLATAFQPILQVVIPIIVQLMQWLASATAAVVQFMSVLSGKSVKSMQDAAKGMDKLGASTKSAGKAAKGAVASFDELNMLQAPDAGGGGDEGIAPVYADIEIGQGVLDFIDQIKDLLHIFDPLVDRVRDFFDAIKRQFEQAGDWGNAFSDFFLTLADTIRAVFETIAAVVFPIIEALNIPQILFNGLEMLTSYLALIRDVLDTIRPGIEAFVDLFLVPIAEWIGSKVADGLKFFSNEFGIMGEWFKANEAMFTRLGTALGNFFGGIWNALRPLLDPIWQGIKDLISTFYELGRTIAERLLPFLSAFYEFWARILQLFADNGVFVALGQVISGLFDVLIGIITFDFDRIWEGVKKIGEGVWEAVKGIVTSVAQLFNELLAWLGPNVVEPIIKFFEGLWKSISGFFAQLWEDIVEIWNDAKDWFNNTVIKPIVAFFAGLWDGLKNGFKTAWDFIKGVWESVSDWFNTNIIQPVAGFFKSLWDGIGEAAANVWHGIKVGVISMVNFVIDVINAMVKGILAPFNLLIDGLNLIPGVDIPSLSLSIPKIAVPALATGTVVPPNKEFLALMGDNKHEPEIVSPLSTMKQAFKEAMSESGGGGDSAILRSIESLLERIAAKEGNVVFAPSADAGRVIARSTDLFTLQRG